MALFDRLRKFYYCPCRCYNCGFSMDCKIPKGFTIDSWLNSPEALCVNCSNPTLNRIDTVHLPLDIKKSINQIQKQTKQPEEQSQRFPGKLVYPPNSQRQPLQPIKRIQRVIRPVDYPVRPEPKEEISDFLPPMGVPKRVNLWTGREI